MPSKNRRMADMVLKTMEPAQGDQYSPINFTDKKLLYKFPDHAGHIKSMSNSHDFPDYDSSKTQTTQSGVELSFLVSIIQQFLSI